MLPTKQNRPSASETPSNPSPPFPAKLPLAPLDPALGVLELVWTDEAADERAAALVSLVTAAEGVAEVEEEVEEGSLPAFVVCAKKLSLVVFVSDPISRTVSVLECIVRANLLGRGDLRVRVLVRVPSPSVVVELR